MPSIRPNVKPLDRVTSCSCLTASESPRTPPSSFGGDQCLQMKSQASRRNRIPAPSPPLPSNPSIFRLRPAKSPSRYFGTSTLWTLAAVTVHDPSADKLTNRTRRPFGLRPFFPSLSDSSVSRPTRKLSHHPSRNQRSPSFAHRGKPPPDPPLTRRRIIRHSVSD